MLKALTAHGKYLERQRKAMELSDTLSLGAAKRLKLQGKDEATLQVSAALHIDDDAIAHQVVNHVLYCLSK